MPPAMDLLSPKERNLPHIFPSTALYYCKDCLLAFRFPSLSEEATEELYKDMPTQRWQYNDHSNVAWELARLTISRYRSSTSTKRLLDIGAFDGAFLKSIPDDWEKSAIEPSQSAREHLCKSGVNIIADYLKSPRQSDAQSFDVVTLFDVLEHLPQPGQSIANALQYLRPNGILIISTGNADHWTWKYLRGEHWYVLPLQHICFATTGYFQKIAGKEQVQILECRKHAHQYTSLKQKLIQATESVAIAGVNTPGALALIRRGLLALPGLSYLRHRTYAPHGAGLNDHLYVVLRKSP